MKVFIFGAGASKASQIDELRPSRKSPLVDELFDDVYHTWAEMVGLTKVELDDCMENIRKIGSLEKWLTDRWEKISTYKTPRTQDSEKYFFGKVTLYIWLTLLKISETYNEKNLYYTFLRKLKKADEEYGIISFNYDLLLDRAIQDVCGYTLGSIQVYIHKARYIKPHGSVNWLVPKRIDDPKIQSEYHLETRVRLDMSSENMFKDKPLSLNGLQIIEPTHRDLHEVDHMIKRFNDQYFYPIILMPLTIKQYNQIEDFQETIIENGKKLISEAQEIYLIGYRGKDKTIDDFLRKARKGTKLYVIGRNDTLGIAKNITSRHRQLSIKPHGNRSFEQFVEQYI